MPYTPTQIFGLTINRKGFRFGELFELGSIGFEDHATECRYPSAAVRRSHALENPLLPAPYNNMHSAGFLRSVVHLQKDAVLALG